MIRRPLICTIVLSIVVAFLAGCGRGEDASALSFKGQYQIQGKLLSPDSLTQLVIVADHHGAVQCDTVPVAADGSFSFACAPISVDEVYVYYPSGDAVRMYAEAEGRYEISIDSAGLISFADSDMFNTWIRQREALFAPSVKNEVRKSVMDSLCRTYPSDIRTTLLLREHISSLDDSLLVRRCLGSLQASAKPEWLMADIDYRLALKRQLSLPMRERLKPLPVLTCWSDSALSLDLQASRAQSVLLYFWADYDSASVDSLQMFAQLAKQYGLYDEFAHFERKKGRQPRRIELVSICLHAADSAGWKQAIASVPGRHCLLEAGFSDASVSAWRIQRVPYTLVIDRFSSLLGVDVWGSEMRSLLDRATVNTDQPESKSAAVSSSAPEKNPSKSAARTPKGARMERPR